MAYDISRCDYDTVRSTEPNPHDSTAGRGGVTRYREKEDRDCPKVRLEVIDCVGRATWRRGRTTFMHMEATSLRDVTSYDQFCRLNPVVAKDSYPDSLRALFGNQSTWSQTNMTSCAEHVSANAENAEREFGFFFPKKARDQHHFPA